MSCVHILRFRSSGVHGARKLHKKPVATILIGACLAAAAVLLGGASSLRADLIMDESTHTLNTSVNGPNPGILWGFEFTTPAGSSFLLDEIKGSWHTRNGYGGTTDFVLYTRLGADLTPISTAVGITGIPDTTTATFDFATHATTINFSSQSILLDPGMQYTILGEHHGGIGSLGIHYSFSFPTGPIPGAGRVSASNTLDDANFSDHNDVIFQVFSTPVPEPSSASLLLGAALAALIRRRH